MMPMPACGMVIRLVNSAGTEEAAAELRRVIDAQPGGRSSTWQSCFWVAQSKRWEDLMKQNGVLKMPSFCTQMYSAHRLALAYLARQSGDRPGARYARFEVSRHFRDSTKDPIHGGLITSRIRRTLRRSSHRCGNWQARTPDDPASNSLLSRDGHRGASVRLRRRCSRARLNRSASMSS